MPDVEPVKINPLASMPPWGWAIVLMGGGGTIGLGTAGAGGLFGEPAASKAEVAELQAQVDALDDKIDERLDGIERSMDRLGFALGVAPSE